MQRLVRLLSVFVVALLVTCCTSPADSQREIREGDTLYTAEAAIETYYKNPQRALVIIDSAEQVGNMTKLQANIVRARIYSNDETAMDTARTLCMQMLDQGNLTAE